MSTATMDAGNIFRAVFDPATQALKVVPGTGGGATGPIQTQETTGLVPVIYDDIVITYVGASQNINNVVYKHLGSTVATLTFSYDGSTRLIEVVRT